MSTRKTILLVDDDVDLLENTAFMLRSSGYEVITAKDGEEAITEYKEIKPNLVIMDIKMPKMDGFDAFFKIKQYDPDAKVILITAYFVDEIKHLKAKSMSLITTINKPFTFESLDEHVRKYA